MRLTIREYFKHHKSYDEAKIVVPFFSLENSLYWVPDIGFREDES
jgi:hypothetical protein